MFKILQLFHTAGSRWRHHPIQSKVIFKQCPQETEILWHKNIQNYMIPVDMT